MFEKLFEFGRVGESLAFEEEVAKRTLRLGSAFAALASGVFGTYYLLNGPGHFVPANWLATLVFAAFAVLQVRNLALALYAVITAALALLGYQMAMLGGVDNGSAVWLIAPNLAAWTLGMRRLAIYCGAVSTVVIVGVVTTSRLGWLTPQAELTDPDLVMALSLISVQILCGAFAFIVVRARERLWVEIGERTAQLATALTEAEVARNAALEASRSKERFFANLTHEIRTPLNGIIGTGDLLRRTRLSRDQEPLVEALAVSAQDLIELVNAMLDHAKLSAGHITVDAAPVDLRSLTAGVADLFRARAEEKGLALAVAIAPDCPAWVRTDRTKLRQIIANLVSNAIKFTSRGSVSLSLRVEPARPGDDRTTLVFEVADSGIGIAPGNLASIFEPFMQGDASITRRFGGTGLGLAIARQLAGLLGGTLIAESAVGQGSRFTLTLSAPAVDGPAELGPSAVARDSARASGPAPSVLLAEDNAVNQLVSRSMLEALGARVEVANNGAAAIGLARSKDFDLILMDLQMPDMDGITAAHRIRSDEARRGRPAVPIVAFTGNSPSDYAQACNCAGMNGFLTKPANMEEVRAVLERFAAHP